MTLLTIEEFRRSARKALPRFVFDYVDGGAESEDCLSRNTCDLRHLHLVPKCMRDTRSIDTSIDVFAAHWKAPLGIAPTGLNGLVRPHGDLMMAKAAADAGIPFVLSTASNERLEAVRAAAPSGIQWLQLYVVKDRGIAEQLLKRAHRENYGALVVTVDCQVGGYRLRDLRNGFRLPFRPGPRTLLDILLHPGWLARVVRHGAPNFVNLAASDAKGVSAQVQAALLSRNMDCGFVWDNLDWIRTLWHGPLLLKGILHPEDARRAVRAGVDGLIVSNHGGRQLDAAPSAIAALPAVLEAVGNQVPVFIDSGFRSGDDVVKALALGARAVFVGRPPLYGLACAGQAGVDGVLNLLVEQLVRTMTMIGAASIQDIDQQHLMANPFAH